MNSRIQTNETDAVVEKVLGCNLKITHLVTVGCSFTFCQGLENKLENGWPAVIAKSLNIPLVNLGVPGVGNDSICRKTYEYFYENLPTNSNPLFIIAWSQYWRREAWVRRQHYQNINNYAPVSLEQDSPKNAHEKAVLEDWNEIDHIRRTYMNKLSLINLFNAHNTNYLMTDYMVEMKQEENEFKVKTIFPNVFDAVYKDPNKITNFYSLSNSYPKTVCQHDGVEGNRAIAEYTLGQINNKFTEFTNEHEYLTLSSYIKTQPHMERFPDWCNFVL